MTGTKKDNIKTTGAKKDNIKTTGAKKDNIKILKGVILVGEELTEFKGYIRIVNGIIVEISKGPVDTTNGLVIDMGENIICPGFINTHDHLNYNDVPPQKIPINCKNGKQWVYDDRYRWGQKGTQEIQFNRPDVNSLNGMRGVEMYSSIRHLLGGTTSIVGSLVGTPGLLRNLSVDCNASYQDPTAFKYNSKSCVTKDKKEYSIFSGFPIQIAEAGLPEVFPTGNTAFSLKAKTSKQDADCNILPIDNISKELNRPDTLTDPKPQSDSTFIHIGEGVNVYARTELDAAILNESKYTGSNKGLIHAIAVTSDHIQKIKDTKTNVIWSPRSNLSLYGYTTPIPKLLEAGINVTLSTDWVLSGSINLLREFKCAKSIYPRIKSRDLVKMVTVNAAKACSSSKYIGSIEVGKLADFCVFNKNDKYKDPYSVIINSSTSDNLLTMVNGDVVIINNDILSKYPDLKTAGEWVKGFMGEYTPIQIKSCNTDKTLFSPYSWEVIREQINHMYFRQGRYPVEISVDINTPGVLYPLDFCNDPTDEPLCIPNRPPIYGIENPNETNCWRYPCTS